MKRAFLSASVGIAALAFCAQAIAAVGRAPSDATVLEPATVALVRDLVLPPVTVSSSVVRTNTASQLTQTALPTTSTLSQSQVATTSAIPTPQAAAATASGSTASATTSAPPASIAGNAALTIYGQSGDTVSMQVPASFKVVRTGGTEALTLTTNTNVEHGIADQGNVLGGTVAGSDTMSVNVGAALALASAGPLVAGPYQGVLVLVVQYN
ncbi:DUF4402 domain-containing protein [Phenylobacterium sp.]|uniref:DUF4402 domain-containing protein n=1 Tax=Phenylobacterium sp. TaxID=1871053 RepID=UPI00398336D1